MKNKISNSLNNKGQVGLDTTKTVMVALLIVAVIGFASMILLSTLNNTSVASTTGSDTLLNETLSSNVTETAVNLANSDKIDASCTLTSVNAFNGSGVNYVIGLASGNYTQTNCAIAHASTDIEYNNSVWQVYYTLTYNTVADANRNITTGVTDFFANATTWFAMLSVVVIILIIAIIIFAVNRFGRGRGAGL